MINQELLEQIKIITPEEQGFLDGKGQLDQEIFLETDSHIVDSGKILDSGKLIKIRPHARFVHYPEHTIILLKRCICAPDRRGI
jgi:hypothetical protein